MYFEINLTSLLVAFSFFFLLRMFIVFNVKMDRKYYFFIYFVTCLLLVNKQRCKNIDGGVKDLLNLIVRQGHNTY